MFSSQPDREPDLRLAILAAARELACDPEGLSMRTLAQRVGCAPGTIYLYFANKSELLEQVAEENLARLSQLLDGLKQRHRHGDPVLLLKKALYTCVEFRLRHPEHHLASASMLLVPIEIVEEFVSLCIQQDAFRPEVDRDAACLFVCATIHGLASMLIAQGVQAHRETVIEQVINTAVEGLCERSSNARARGASVA